MARLSPSRGGYSPSELQEAGFNAKTLKEEGVNLLALQQANTPVPDLRAAGYKADRLRQQGYTAAALAKGGYTASEMRGDRVVTGGFFSGYTAYANAPVSQPRSRASPNGQCVALPLVATARASPNAWRGRSRSLVATAHRRQVASPRLHRGSPQAEGPFCRALDLLAAPPFGRASRLTGWAPHAAARRKELRDGRVLFTAANLKAGGYEVFELRGGGYTASELKAKGFSAADLHAGGFGSVELLDGGYGTADLRAVGYQVSAMREIGVNVAELRRIGYKCSELRKGGFSASELAATGQGRVYLRSGAPWC